MIIVMIIVTRAGIRGLKAHQCVGLPSYSGSRVNRPYHHRRSDGANSQRCNSLKFIDFEVVI